MARRCRVFLSSANPERQGAAGAAGATGSLRLPRGSVEDFGVAAPASGDRREFIDEVVARVIGKLQALAADPKTTSKGDDAALVFVICPFDPEMEPVFDAIAAAAAAVGMRAERVKDVQGDYRITEKMLTLIRAARLIVADLSRERPNVYFELGYARGLGKTVITIVRTGALVHFDVQDWPYIEYIDSRPLEHEMLERFRYELQQAQHVPS